LTSHVCINCEPACRDVSGEKSDEDGDSDYANRKERGKGRDDDEEDEDGDDDDDEDEDGNEDDEEEEDEGEGGDAPVVRFGPPKGHSGAGKSAHQEVVDASFALSVDGNISNCHR
jgi:hypothetical protein